MVRYVATRVPIDVYNELKRKQINMSEMYFKLTGKKKNVPLTRVLRVVTKTPIYIEDNQLVRIFRRKRK